MAVAVPVNKTAADRASRFASAFAPRPMVALFIQRSNFGFSVFIITHAAVSSATMVSPIVAIPQAPASAGLQQIAYMVSSPATSHHDPSSAPFALPMVWLLYLSPWIVRPAILGPGCAFHPTCGGAVCQHLTRGENPQLDGSTPTYGDADGGRYPTAKATEEDPSQSACP